MQSESSGADHEAERLQSEALQTQSLLDIIEDRPEPSLDLIRSNPLDDPVSKEAAGLSVVKAREFPVRAETSVKDSPASITRAEKLVSQLGKLGITFQALGEDHSPYADLEEVLRSGYTAYSRQQISTLAKRGHPGIITWPDGSIRINPEGVLRLFDYIHAPELDSNKGVSGNILSTESPSPIPNPEPAAKPVLPTLSGELPPKSNQETASGISEESELSEGAENIAGSLQFKVYKNSHKTGGRVITPNGREIKFTDSLGWDFLRWLTGFQDQVVPYDIVRTKAIEFGYVGSAPLSPLLRMLYRLEKDSTHPEYFFRGDKEYILKARIVDGEKADQESKIAVASQTEGNLVTKVALVDKQPSADPIPPPAIAGSASAKLGVAPQRVSAPSFILRPKNISVTPEERSNRPSQLPQAVIEPVGSVPETLLNPSSLHGLESLILSQILHAKVHGTSLGQESEPTRDITMLLGKLSASEKPPALGSIPLGKARQLILDQVIADLKDRFNPEKSYSSATATERIVARQLQILKSNRLTEHHVINYIEDQFNPEQT